MIESFTKHFEKDLFGNKCSPSGPEEFLSSNVKRVYMIDIRFRLKTKQMIGIDTGYPSLGTIFYSIEQIKFLFLIEY